MLGDRRARLGALVMAPVLNLLLKAYGIGAPAPPSTRRRSLAPQATLMASVAKGMFGGAPALEHDRDRRGDRRPRDHRSTSGSKARGASFRAPVLAVAVGIYLPLELSVPIFVGGLIAELATRWHKRRNPGKDPEILKQMGLLFSAGLIAGEALIGVLIAIPIAATKNADVLAVPANMQPGQWAGLAALGLIGWWMYIVSTKQAKH